MQSDSGHLGYLISFSDAIVIPWNIRRLNADRFWVSNPLSAVMACGEVAFTPESRLVNASAKLQQRLRANLHLFYTNHSDEIQVCERFDTVYIPGRLSRDASHVFTIMLKDGVGVKDAIGTMLAALAPLDTHRAQMLTAHGGAIKSTYGNSWPRESDTVYPLNVSAW